MRRSTRPSAYELSEVDAAIPENTDVGVSLAFPEGGREAWTCLLGSALLMFPSFGFQTAGETISQQANRLNLTALQWDRFRTISVHIS
jgi:hypothetical protein